MHARIEVASRETKWRVAPDCMLAMKRQLDLGLEQKAAPGTEVELDEAALYRADDSIQRLIEEMGRQALDRGEQSFTAETLRRALSGLCPGLWPFC